MVLAAERPSFFDYWNEPIFPAEGFSKIQGVLDEYEHETEEWRNASSINVWESIEEKISGKEIK